MVSVMLYHCIFCVALLMDMFVLCVACMTGSVNCLVKQFAICLGVVVILLLNVMEVLSVGGGSLLDIPCMVFQIMCVLCCDFALLMLFLCVIFHTMWSDKSTQLLCILPFCILCLSAIIMMFAKIILSVCMLVAIVV